MSRTSQTRTSGNPKQITDPSPLGINPDTKFNEEVPVYSHNSMDTIELLFTDYTEDDETNIRLGNETQKAKNVIEVLKKSQAVLVEVEPWFVSQHMGSPEFDRWEPFFVAFPECARNRQMKFTNIAPLSEVSHRISQRDIALEKISGTQQDELSVSDTESISEQLRKAKNEEHKAFTRYELDCAYTGSEDSASKRGVWVDMKPIKTIHTCLSPWHEHLLIGVNDETGELYCGRDAQFSDHVDVAIDLDRRTSDYDKEERKVAVYNDKGQKDAIEQLDFDQTHRQYLGAKARWEIDAASIAYTVRSLLEHETIEFVSLNRIMEKEFIINYDKGFHTDINGYPGFN